MAETVLLVNGIPGAGKTTLARALAAELVWELASALETTVIIESNLYGAESRQWTVRGLARSGRPRVIELWCAVPVALANERYDARVRHPIHPTGSERSDASAAAEAEPLDTGLVLRVDTTSTVDVAALAASISDTIRATPTLGR